MAIQGKKIKIALVGYKLANGGLERVLSTVSELLHYSNCEVCGIVLENEVEYPFHGTLINLGGYSKFKKYFKLRRYLKRNQFDYVIDFRHRINPWMELLFIHYIYSGFKFIYTIHSSKLEVYLTSKGWISKQMLYRAYRIVSVSGALNEKIKKKYQFHDCVVIPNSIAEKSCEAECLDALFPFEYCIAVGRLVELKQFDKLIDAYCNSNLRKSEIHLVIVGDGIEKENLLMQIASLKLTKFVHLLGFRNDAICYIKEARFLVLSSKYEGFPMVVLEALNAGIPVVSFDCETGPNELVQHEFNGLLVKDQDFVALQMVINRIVDGNHLYNFCKQNSKTSVQSFLGENIQKKWLKLLSINEV